MKIKEVLNSGRQLFVGIERKKEERRKELKESFLGSWEVITENNLLIISINDDNQVKVLLNAMKDIKRLEKVTDIVGELSDMVMLYSNLRLDIKDNIKTKLMAKKIIDRNIEELNKLFSINLQF